MADLKDIKLAKRLARLVLEAGEDGIKELKPALERIIAGRSAADRRAFLKGFHKAVVLELHRDTLIVESASELPEEVVRQVVDSFKAQHDRPIHLERRINPDLIAGLRVRLGDSVYDASLANSLQALATRIR